MDTSAMNTSSTTNKKPDEGGGDDNDPNIGCSNDVTTATKVNYDAYDDDDDDILWLAKFCEALPKVELHAHLNGCIRESTLIDLAQTKGIPLVSSLHQHSTTVSSGKVHKHYLGTNGTRRNLKDCFEIFDEIHLVINDLPSLRRLTQETLEDFYMEGVIYLELRSTPRYLQQQNINDNEQQQQSSSSSFNTRWEGKVQYVQTILDEFIQFETTRTHNRRLIPRLLISIDRSKSTEEAEENVNVALHLLTLPKYAPYVVGMDFGGNPNKNSFDMYRPALQRAKDAGLGITLHCGEVPLGGDNSNDKDETTQMIQFQPNRLGHVLCLTQHHINLLQNQPIPIECCPTSNIMTLEYVNHLPGNSLVDGLRQHPHLSSWWIERLMSSSSSSAKTGTDTKQNHCHECYPISINTDDPGVFNTNSTREWLLLSKAFHLSPEALLFLTKMQFGFSNYSNKLENKASLSTTAKQTSMLFDTSPSTKEVLREQLLYGLQQATDKLNLWREAKTNKPKTNI